MKKKCSDFERVQNEYNLKEGQIADLNLAIKSLNEQVFKLKKHEQNTKPRQITPEDYLYIEQFHMYENQIVAKDKEIEELKYEALKLKQKYATLESRLDNYYKLQLQKDKERGKLEVELKVKENVIEKEMKINSYEKELELYYVKLKEYENSYLHLDDHQLIVTKANNELAKQLEINKGLELDLGKMKIEKSTYLEIDQEI